MGHVHLFQTNSQYHDMMICDILYIYIYLFIYLYLGFLRGSPSHHRFQYKNCLFWMILVFHVYPYLCLRGGAVSLPAKNLGLLSTVSKKQHMSLHMPLKWWILSDKKVKQQHMILSKSKYIPLVSLVGGFNHLDKY